MKVATVMRPMSAALSLCFVAVGLSSVLHGCNKKSVPMTQVPADARPELRQAVSAICKSGQLLDNYDDELQVAYRLHILTEEQHFKPEPKERTTLRAIMSNEALSSYSRMCAAFFLADSERDARALLTNYVASSNLRRRFNAARTIQWFAGRRNDEAREWAVSELIKLVENKSLELPPNPSTHSSATEADGYDYKDETLTPLMNVVYLLGELRELRAVPGLTSLVHSANGYDYGASSALQKITSPPVRIIPTQEQDKARFEALLTQVDLGEANRDRVEAIRSLGQYADQRAIDKLFTIAVSSHSTLLRGNAIWTLAAWTIRTLCSPWFRLSKLTLSLPRNLTNKLSFKTARLITPGEKLHMRSDKHPSRISNMTRRNGGIGSSLSGVN
jgi:hypothetical protein